MSSEAETIYERVAKLEDEIALLRSELDIIKRAFRNKLARHEISMIKEGKDIDSILWLIFCLYTSNQFQNKIHIIGIRIYC